MFLNDFLSWCEAKGVTPQQVMNEIGLDNKTFQTWQTCVPLKNVLPKLADYFGLSIETLCDAVWDHQHHRINYKPKIYTVETVARNGTVMTRSTYEYIPQLPLPWACRRLTTERLVSDEYLTDYKARTIAMAAPDAVPILRKNGERK